jgi:hypothetical protein
VQHLFSGAAAAGIFLSEVVVLFNGFFDLPGALKAVRKDHVIALAETYRIRAIGYRYAAFNQKAGFLLRVLPVEGAWFAVPDGPGLAGFGFGIRGLFDNYIFYGGHFVSPDSFISIGNQYNYGSQRTEEKSLRR